MTPLVFDMTRLIGRGRFSTPTGIDRFELHYARWVRMRRHPRDLFIETLRDGPAIIRRERADAIIDDARARWLERSPSAEQTSRLQAVLAAARGGPPLSGQGPARARPLASRAEALLERAVGALRSIAVLRASLPADTTFVHVSHTRLDRPPAFDWLEAAARRGVFYVHDLIPLSHPEFVRTGEADRHVRRMETVLRFARLVICNTRFTAEAFRAFAEARAGRVPPIAVVAPGVDEAFLLPAHGHAIDPGRPYFVCVGTIEPRKNHALLLNVWRRLRERDGERAPRLVIVGRRGWDNVDLFRRLDRTELPQGSVIEVSDLGDAALAPLVAGAAALLAPSFVEGYGMPIAEALTMGTPVIASDIAAHREVAAGAATLIDPLDGPAWIAAIDVHAVLRRRVAAAQRPRRAWTDHFRAVDALIADAGAATAPNPQILHTADVVPLFAAGRRPRGPRVPAFDPDCSSGGRSGRPG